MSTALRSEGASVSALNLLANTDTRTGIELALVRAGDTVADSLSMVGRGMTWSHTLDFRCEPIGRGIDGMETAAVMDTHDELSGSLMVGSRPEAVDHLATLMTSLESGSELSTNERAQEATNIIGSAYLNGLRLTLDADDFSERSFLPSPPRFVQSTVETMLELAVSGQAFGDRGWIAEHRFQCDTAQFVSVWVPSCVALVSLGQRAVRGTQ